MDPYTTSITNLYELRSTLVPLQEEYDKILSQLGQEEDPDLIWRLQTLGTQITQTQHEINVSISKLYADPLTDPLLQIEEHNPILLLPLRLETRFVESRKELWIRVYPDEISIHTHETALTESEIKAGRYYWRELWKNTDRKKAWSQVANRFGVNRATWILLKTRPAELIIKPNGDYDFGKITTSKDLDPGPVKTKSHAWSEAAKSYVMPDLLKLRMFIGDDLVFETLGNPIVQPLPVGPDPKSTASPANANLDWKDTDIAWMEDFDKAVEVGMAFKINLSAILKYKPEVGFSRITVMGIRTLFDQSPLVEPPPKAGTGSLTTLFENHQYSLRGLALVSQGTPTNNTEEKKSGYREQPVFTEERYKQEQQTFKVTKYYDEMEDGKILALALGLNPVLFQKLENSLNTDHRDAVSMNKALYPATLGFFLRHLLNPLFKAAELDTIRSFFCSYVTGRGPIPVLRTGPQPYGILPTSNFKVFQWNAADKDYNLFQELTKLLNKLDAVYEASIPNISKLGQQKEPHVLLDEILGLYPNSETFYQRVGYSENFLRNCLGQSITTPSNQLLGQIIKKFKGYGGAKPEGILQLEKIVFERTTLPLNRHRLVDLVTASETKKISIPVPLEQYWDATNYIQWLSEYYIRDPSLKNRIEEDYYKLEIGPPLLYLLLKHGLLIQLYKCVFHWLSAENYLDPRITIFYNSKLFFLGSKEYLNFFQDQEDISPMELMLIDNDNNNLPFLNPEETAAAYFLNNQKAILKAINQRVTLKPEVLHDFRHLEEFFETLDYLSNLTTARLERAMIEHLDCLTYRRDTWQTGLCYKKLELNRSTGLATGTVLGAYGWLENLRPANITFIQEADLPKELRPDAGMPVIKADDHGGYIHAPSLTQAKAAALLRNAYLHHYDPKNPNPEIMAVNLSSLRVRKALEIFEGMQKGHSVGELLGYRLERHMHDQATPLDQYIPVLRKGFPLGGKAVSNPESNDQPSTTQEKKPDDWVARLDGLAIVNAIKGSKKYPFGLALPGTDTDEAKAINKGIDDLLDCIDAMKDLMVAESIHQLVQGNTERAGALLKSVGELKPPAKFESIRTPRTPAEILTHRACVIFNPKPANPWPKVAISPRAMTEPGLNEWLGEIIGSPDTFQCTVTSKAADKKVVTIEDLNLQPIDLVYLAPMQLDNEESELSRRIAYHYLITHNITEEIDIKIEYDKADKDKLSMAEALPLLKLLKEVVTISRALDAADFDLQQYQGKANYRNLSVEKSGGNTIDVGSLLKRKNNLTAALTSLSGKLYFLITELMDEQYPESEKKTFDETRKCLIECSCFDIRDAFPKSAVGEGYEVRDALLLQAQKVRIQMLKIIGSAQNIRPNEEELIKSFTLFFGPAFKVLPVFHFEKKGDDEVGRLDFVRDAYKAEKDIFSFIEGKTNISLDKHLQNWLNEVSYLRPKLASFELVRLLYNSFQEKKQLGMHIMQLPYEAGDIWLGLEFPAGLQADKGKLSMLVHHFPQNTTPDWETSDFSGLLLDEWVEEIPGKEELTGISFQYNQPDSQPPQALLLAISPTEGHKWSWNTLSDIIDDTLRRAKQRAFGTEELSNTDWIGVLPAIIAEFSNTKANVSLLFRN